MAKTQKIIAKSSRKYQIEIIRHDRSIFSPVEMLRKVIKQEKVYYEHVFYLENDFKLSVAVSKVKDRYHVTLITDLPGPMILHWGVTRRFSDEWFLPPSSIHPAGTTVFQDSAAQTPFIDIAGFRQLHTYMNKQEAPMGISFVIKQIDTDSWIKDNGRNFYIPVGVIPAEHETPPVNTKLTGLINQITEKEMGRNSWTLMHRFNLCYDLLDKIKRNNIDGLALIFVWLRFSALRQLDWQRNYNTKPRELGHAMDRLTLKLADRYSSEPGERELIRLIMTTLGRGKDAQRVRDEILHIMHRHNIKEVSGHFMEEWHQKLHNNATPDDIVICEAYLEFLRSDGNLDRFYKRLEEGGVTKKRIEGYERPIKSHPEFIPYLKEVLIHNFEHFLGILKEVHSGADLGSSIHLARHLFNAEMHGLMDFIWSHRDDRKILSTLFEKITESRRRLAEQFKGPSYKARDILFLDIALEDFLRGVVERNLSAQLSGNQLVDLVAMVLENLCLSSPDEEFIYCLNLWKRLKDMPRFEREWSLRAGAVLDRLRRALGSLIDRYCQLLRPKAEFLGHAFHATPWTISLFSEEALRGRPAFALSMLLRYLDPLLRKSANLGSWQVISRGHGIGEVKVVEKLRSIQGKTFARPNVIVAGSIAGDEEIPEGVTAIITPAVIDSLSHLAIRARNAGILFATCYDTEVIERLKTLDKHFLKLNVSNTNNVLFEESHEEIGVISQCVKSVRAAISRPVFTAYPLTINDFNERNVGYKSNNLRRLLGKLPEWICLPISAALPYGVFEKVISEESNKEIAKKYWELNSRIDDLAEKERSEALTELRKTIQALKAPDDLASSLYEVTEKSGLKWPANWDEAWMYIKRVWGSKWNERAYLSRKANGISHDDLFMSVLIQLVVEADYSFVIHTVNPLTGIKDEIYAEVVMGLGETLAGNYPGKALSFTCKKGKEQPHLLSFPSKSAGLFGNGLIFRSDSNGEDLIGYAGAGLYDSFILPPPRKVSLDYLGDSLVWDDHFRKDFLVTIAKIGTIIEKVSGSPQDIEGAYSRGRYYVVQTRPQVGIEND